jgi:tetratricopeptide (TPR) repeat protein
MADDPSVPVSEPSEERGTHSLGTATQLQQAAQPFGLPAAIGRYKVIRLLGAGGMGSVYEAEQDQPRRRVALKVIKSQHATPELLRRFQREAEALARLQHPGIAQIYEAGTADSGAGEQPYFAMEFIAQGQRLSAYAEAHRLKVRQRLELMAQVCDAVHHAHQRGLIHRDLKPANILVDERGHPKVLDFGVAHVTDSDAHTIQTDIGQLVGTLAYMSPEQAMADPLELDIRSDVYALGVVLYELLAGKLPYAISGKVHEAVVTIRQEDPAPLSSINRMYRGDIETIVAKALEKDKQRRYASAAGLAADIRRHLNDEPIVARPASVGYQLQKFARRHKAVTLSVAAVFCILVAATFVSVHAALRATRAAAVASALNDFFQNDVLAQASANTQSAASTKPDPDLKVRTALDRAAARIAGKFNSQPEVEAAIRDTMGKTYVDLGLFPEARAQLERALALYRRALGPDHEKTLAVNGRLGDIAFRQGRYKEAESALLDTLKVSRHVLGPEHRAVLQSEYTLGITYLREGKLPQAESTLTETLQAQRRALGSTDLATAKTMNALGAVFRTEGKPAEKLFSEVLQTFGRVLGPEHPDTLTAMSNLGLVYVDQAKYEPAEALLKQSLEIRRRVLGADHPATLASAGNLAIAYLNQGKYSQAESIDTEVFAIRQRVLGPDHSETLAAGNNLAIVFTSEGKYADAEALYSNVMQIQRRILGPEHPDTLTFEANLSEVYIAEGKYAKAEALDSQVLDIQRRILGLDHSLTMMTLYDLATSQSLQGKYEQAEPLYTQVLETRRRVLGSGHPDTLSTLSAIASMYMRWGKYAQAEEYGSKALDGRRKALGPDHADTLSAGEDLALIFLLLGKAMAAEQLARDTLAIEEKKRPDDWQRFRAEILLGASLAAETKDVDAERFLLRGYEGIISRKNRISVPDQSHIDRATEWLVKFYEASGNPRKAAQWEQKLKPKHGSEL